MKIELNLNPEIINNMKNEYPGVDMAPAIESFSNAHFSSLESVRQYHHQNEKEKIYAKVKT